AERRAGRRRNRSPSHGTHARGHGARCRVGGPCRPDCQDRRKPHREAGGVTVLRRLLALAAMPRRRVALSIATASLTVLFGVGLIATSGYLISRAAEQPPVLSLTEAIVVVRFFGLGRPLMRYLDRLLSHDLALRGGAPELVLYGRTDDRLAAILEADQRLARHARRDATVAGLGTALVALVAGLTTVAVLAAAVSAHAHGRLDQVLVATVALLALASFESVAALPGAAQELGATLAAGDRKSTRLNSSH